MENELKDYFAKLKLISLPRINYAIISKLQEISHEDIVNPYNEFYYVESGSVKIKTGELEFEIGEGEYAFFPQNTSYELCDGGPVIVISVAFFLDDGISEIVSKNEIVFDKVDNTKLVENESVYFPFTGKIRASEKTYSFLKEIINDYDGMEEYCNVNVSSLTVSFLVELANSSLSNIKNEGKEYGVAEKYCEKIDQYIENNYFNVITMDIIARYMGMHANYLSDIYRNNRGITVMKKLTLYRLSKAKDLLSRKKYTIKEVSKMVGYRDCKYFNAVFKKYEHVTPGKYVQQFYEDKIYSYSTIRDEEDSF